MATPPPPSFLKRHLKKVILLLLVIGGAAAFFLYDPAVKIFKSWRAEALAEQAQEFADAEDWENTKQKAIASMQNEKNFKALRLLAIASVESSDAGTLQILYSLFSDPEAEASDRAMALERVLELRDFRGAAQMIQDLSEEDRKNPVIRYQEVKWLLQTGQAPKAILLADETSETPRDPALDLLLAKGVAASGLEGAREVTTDRLIRVMDGDNQEVALEALDYLPALQDSWIYQPLAEGAILRFEDDPDLSVSQRLVVDFLKIGLDKTTHEKIVADAISEYKEDNLIDLVRWLKRIGKFQEIVDLTTTEEAQSDATLFSERVGALEILGLWEQLDEELKEPPVAIPEPMLYSAQAIAAFKNGNKLKFIQSWEDAIMAAQRDLKQNWFYQLSVSAQRLGDSDRYMNALAQAVLHPLGSPPNSSQLSPLFKWILDRGETERLQKITEALLKGEPNTPLLINNLVYLKALHGNVDSDDIARLQELIENYPKQKSLLDSLALAQLQINKPEEALETLAKISSDPSKLSSSGQAVFANALYNLGKEEEAFEMADKIRWKDLSQAEIAILAITRPQ